MQNLDIEKIEILKTKVKLTISLSTNEYRNINESALALLNLAIKSGASENALKQIFNDKGGIKINSKHTFH